jgi:hypothetical protein
MLLKPSEYLGLTLVHFSAQRYTRFVGHAGWRQRLSVSLSVKNMAKSSA